MSAFFVSPLEKGSSKAPIRRGPYSLRRPAGFLRKVTYIILTGTLHAWGARGFLEAPGSRTTNWLCEASSFSIAHPVVGHKLVGGLDTSSPNLTHNDAKTLLVLTSFLTISSGGDSLLSRHRPRQLSSIAPDGGGIQSDMGPSREGHPAVMSFRLASMEFETQIINFFMECATSPSCWTSHLSFAIA
eukprot:scaffold60087_cov15-Tisochrysis_lutea.AAC.1